MGRFDIRTRAGLLSAIVQGQSASPSDGDAQAFIFRVESAGGTLTTTEKNSINTLVVRLKAANIWTKMKALYPMVGSSAAACAQNLRSSSFTGAFSGGWTFASTGATPNGTNGFMETNFVPSTHSSLNNVHISYYSRTQAGAGGVEIGATNGPGVNEFYFGYNAFPGSYMALYSGALLLTALPTTTKMFIASRLTSTEAKAYYDGSLYQTVASNSQALTTLSVYLAALHAGSTSYYSTKECAFASIGDGLTDAEASNFHGAVQEFQTLLGRQIGAPSVSDPDASAFIQRVYTAGGTLTTTEQNAVNQLTIDLKAASIWTGMKAVYPMVGASAAACAQNLRTGSFTGTFNGTISYNSTGITGNGTTGYLNTGLTPSTSLTTANHHISFYSRTNPGASNEIDIGVYEPNVGYSGPALRTRNASNQISYLMGTAGSYNDTISSNTDSRGLFIGNILATNNRKTYKNGSISGTNTTNGNADSGTGPIYVLAVNRYPSSAGSFSIKECAFASIGDGLTDTQATYLNNAVETFQTSLSRNVGAIIPTVSDADAQDYIARVYGAGGTLSTTEQNAVNQLVISMKVAGVWTAMKAVYPMVGASAAACAQNLRSSSYTGTFNGGWTFASTGVTPNGSSAYMDTLFIPLNDNIASSSHMSYYSRTLSTTGTQIDMGCYQGGVNPNQLVISLNGTTTYACPNNTSDSQVQFSSNSQGFFLASRTSSNNIFGQRNSTQISGTMTEARNNTKIFIGAVNYGGPFYYSTKQCAFASIGDGLTLIQASDFYSAVQAFQTTLSRNV